MSHTNGNWMNSEQREADRWAALFPIMGDKVSTRRGYMPMAIMKECEAQAQLNHGQSIQRLKERGGLSPSEAYAVIWNRPYYDLWYRGGTPPNEDALWRDLQRMAKERFPDFDPVTGDCE